MTSVVQNEAAPRRHVHARSNLDSVAAKQALIKWRVSVNRLVVRRIEYEFETLPALAQYAARYLVVAVHAVLSERTTDGRFDDISHGHIAAWIKGRQIHRQPGVGQAQDVDLHTRSGLEFEPQQEPVDPCVRCNGELDVTLKFSPP